MGGTDTTDSRTQQEDAHFHAFGSDAVEKNLAPARRSEVEKHDDTQPKLKRFFFWKLKKKHWWWSVAALVVFIIGVLLLILFLAIIPALFQKYLDKVKMAVNHVDILSLPTDPAVRSIDADFSVHVSFKAWASASIDSSSATLSYNGKRFGSIVIPAQKFSKHNSSFDLLLRQTVTIEDLEVFGGVSRAMLTQDEVSVNVRAKIRAHAVGLSYGGLTLDRDFTIKAFKNFETPKPQVNQIAINECTSSYFKMLINATLDNESQIGISNIGNLNLTVSYENKYLGQAMTTDPKLSLPRGPSNMMLEGTIYKNPNTTTTFISMAGGLLTGNLPIHVSGDHPYATRTPLFKEAFQALNINFLYTDGLEKIQFLSNCSIASLIA